MRREIVNNIFFVALVLVVGVISLLIVRSLLSYLAAAVMLVFVTYPVYRAVNSYLGHPWISSALVVTGLIVAVIVPAAVIAIMVLDQSIAVFNQVRGEGLSSLDLAILEAEVEALTGIQLNIHERLSTALGDIGRNLTSRVTEIVGAVANFVIGIFVMVFVMFYLYRDGPAVATGIKEMMPLQPSRKDILFREVRKVTWAVLAGHVLTSLIQGVVGGIGFWIFGIENAAFWGFIMIILALIPLIGPFALYLPAAALIVIDGDLGRGVALLAYGLVVVSLIDNLVRPYLVEQRAKVHPVLTLVGVLGGLTALGIMGLFIGPLILALLVATLRTYLHETRETLSRASG